LLSDLVQPTIQFQISNDDLHLHLCNSLLTVLSYFYLVPSGS